MCECEICKRHKEARKHIEFLKSQDYNEIAIFIEKTMDLLNHTEFDLDWLKAKIENKELIYVKG